MAPKQIHLKFQHPPEIWDSFLGVKLDESSYDLLVEEDADVYTPEGEILFRFRKRCLPRNLAEISFSILKEIYEISKNRGIANGSIYLKEASKGYIKKDGTKSKYNFLGNIQGLGSSAIIGYMDRYPRYPFCRETAFNSKNIDDFRKLVPFLQSVDAAYAAMDPVRYRKQKMVVDRTSKDFVIEGTSFTTVTVNQNWQTAVHKDQGDLKDGLSIILVLRQGQFKGGNLVFPHYRAAVKLDSLDLMCFDSHHMHGNTPIVGSPGKFKRVSCVLYYRERMQDCGTAAEELELAKKRKLGDKLYGKLTKGDADLRAEQGPMGDVQDVEEMGT